jgi:restriction system protein
VAAGRGGRSDWERYQQALEREAERERKEAERARVAAEKEEKRRYAEARAAEVDAKNRALEETVEQLSTLLRSGLRRCARLDLDAERVVLNVPPLDLGELAMPVRAPGWEQFAPRPPGALSRMVGGLVRYERREADARAQYEAAVREAERQEIDRQRRVVVVRQEHAARVAKAEDEARRRDEVLSAHIEGVGERKKEDVEQYLMKVLKRVPLPKVFPREAEVTFSSRTEQVVVRFALPSREVVPTVASYKYLTTKDEQRGISRPKNEIGALYRNVVSQVALLCVRDLFDSDEALNSVGFNGHVHATNPATGEQEYPCIISLNVERVDFPADENLSRVTPEACIRRLNAIISNHPYDLEPIEPILDFDLSRFSFVEGFDAVSTLDSRPDLMDMSYTNFEHLVRQIFQAQGAEGWTTQQSNDDGVDAVIVQRKALIKKKFLICTDHPAI